ncbi:cytochrome d ubiquinol oxidase subunit II [Pantoea sp. M_9]|uniref:cytochrome d ubiquinol oxidase subunit II n=1 Tax=Pantoea sp. M_9 TaxID=2608041 RepID=UPI001232D93C|nr:cytochrome d ubiquinol oxidase subunit II [Pantoea sp. M_9]KAA5971357.1 cytochrome d ubiquinol oxidase subunit II [Pantoea sp. M_9]
MMLADLSAAVLIFSLLMYLALDGTDLGVGMLFYAFDTPQHRQWMAHSLLPLWDANETWLVLMAGGMLALFPALYSLLLQTLMVPVFLLLLALFLRALALAYRAQVSTAWRAWLDRLMIASSLVAAFLPGWISGLILVSRPPAGIVIDLSLAPLLCGAGVVAVDLLMGCCWVCWRLGEAAGERARSLAVLVWTCTVICLTGVILLEPTLWQLSWQREPGRLILIAIPLLIVLQAILLWREAMVALLMTTLLLIGAVVTALAFGLYPWLLPFQLRIQEEASSPVTQGVVLTGMLIFLPLTLAYHSWSFWVFKRRHQR